MTKSQLLSLQRQKHRGTLRPRAPREQCPVQPTRQGLVNLRKKGPLGKKVNRFGTISDMDVDSVSDYLSEERKSRSKNTRSLERPLPLPQSQPHPALPPVPIPFPLPNPSLFSDPQIPPLIPPTQPNGDPSPVYRPPPSPARYPTSPRVVVKTGAGRAAKGLQGPPEGGLPGQSK